MCVSALIIYCDHIISYICVLSVLDHIYVC